MFYPTRWIASLREDVHQRKTAEAAVLQALVGRGLDVLVPFGDLQPYDLVVHIPPNSFLRVQCKSGRRQKGCLVFNSRTTDHGKGRLPYLGLADVFGVYYPPRNSVYLVPVRDAPTFFVALRLETPGNNQKRGVRFAAEYEIDRWTVAALRELVPASLSAQGSPTRVEPVLVDRPA